MWCHVKDEKPTPGSEIEIQYDNRILECHTAKNTVYNRSNTLCLTYDEFEFWREKEAS